MKLTLTGCILLSSGFSITAQTNVDAFEKYRREAESSFEKAREQNNRSFQSYKDRINKSFASFISKKWKKTITDKPVSKPVRPEPTPIIIEGKSDTVSNALPHSEPVVVPEVPARPEPVEPIVSSPDSKSSEQIAFTYLGKEYKVRVPRERLSVKSDNRQSLSCAWTSLSKEDYNDLLVDCLCCRKSGSLCDWSFYQFTRELSRQMYGDAEAAESVLTQAYILSQLGYRIRLAKRAGKLVLLLAIDEEVYSTSFTRIGNDKFYCFDDTPGDGTIEFCNFEFPGEKSLSLRISAFPEVAASPMQARCIKSEAYPNLSAAVACDSNLRKFYDSYPACRWEILAAASLSPGVKRQLYPALRKQIASSSEEQAVDKLLNLVQTGFPYKTDNEQFGREKSFFGDETFIYPYCDCEDRSILFSILVKDLLGLDVVLLDYPKHVATAVKFSSNVNGDYFDVDGAHYVICDPTYIGASIGRSMPEMLNQKAKIIRIK